MNIYESKIQALSYRMKSLYDRKRMTYYEWIGMECDDILHDNDSLYSIKYCSINGSTYQIYYCVHQVDYYDLDRVSGFYGEQYEKRIRSIHPDYLKYVEGIITDIEEAHQKYHCNSYSIKRNNNIWIQYKQWKRTTLRK